MQLFGNLEPTDPDSLGGHGFLPHREPDNSAIEKFAATAEFIE